jgi:hypothetical protein
VLWHIDTDHALTFESVSDSDLRVADFESGNYIDNDHGKRRLAAQMPRMSSKNLARVHQLSSSALSWL